MSKRNVSRDETQEKVHQLSLFLDRVVQSDLPTGGPSALEKAIWATQYTHMMHRAFFEEPFSCEAMLRRIRYHRAFSLLLDWGAAHGYPECHIRIDGRVASVIASREHAWLTFCTMRDADDLLARFAMNNPYPYPFRNPVPVQDEIVDPTRDSQIREEVIALGHKRGWWNYLMYAFIPSRGDYRFTQLIDGGEENWRLFAQYGDLAYVSQMCTKLRHQVIRDALYEKAWASGWPQFSYSSWVYEFCVYNCCYAPNASWNPLLK